MTYTEKRKSPRFLFQQMIKISFDRETYIQVTGANISKLGVSFLTNECLEPYSRFFLMFTLSIDDKERVFRCSGMVIHCTKQNEYYAAGIQFTDLTKEDNEFLSEYFNSLK